MDIKISKRRLAVPSLNNSRALLMHSNISSVSYHERIEIQSLKLIWDK